MTAKNTAQQPVSSIPAPDAPSGLLPPGRHRRFWITDDMVAADGNGAPKPWFSTHTVATVFLGRSPAWLRVRMRQSEDYPQSMLVLDGKPIEIHRSSSDDRQFSLADIERTAHALYEAGQINAERFSCTIMMILWCARQHGLFTWEGA